MQPIDPDVDAVVAEYRSHPSLLAVFVDGHVDVVEDIALDELRALLSI